jgi:hypothetical protein
MAVKAGWRENQGVVDEDGRKLLLAAGGAESRCASRA